jgi:hypothetical protein
LRVRTFAPPSSQVVIEVSTRNGYLLANARGRMSTLEDAHAANRFLIESLEATGLGKILLDARRADGSRQGHAGLWDWLKDGKGFDRFALLVESSALRRGFDA